MPGPGESCELSLSAERLEVLFVLHHATVIAYARRRVVAESVEDVVAETFLVAWRRLESVPADPLPWLLAVARNVIGTQRRGARRRYALVVRLRTLRPLPTDPVEGDGLVVAALARLGEKDREALTLIAWDGLQPHEAAVVMGVSPGAFRVRLHRAKRRLRRVLDRPADQSTAVSPTSAPEPKETAS